ncbi:hypothetical protein F4809DRAFT_640890 [Biscogniauxia mediterranea]|nr:hypothetical protein F4809DRAFT_640890 [Biscogniauxia mediterranea]
MQEPIAIIGSGCRFPGEANSPSRLWDLLLKPRDLLRKIDRFNTDGFFHQDGRYHGAANVQHSYLLDEDVRLFDPGFFGIKPVEAESMDPLQRLLLETVYESLENAGIPLEQLQGSDTAFYAGIMATDYWDMLMRDLDTIPQYFATATHRSIIANRVSYLFDWHGPSMSIDTACSSSMLALHGAVQSLRNGESQVAVAAGGNLILGPELYIALSKLGMLSPKGRSAMWDADVDGYGRGEGFVAIVMKRLSDAIRDGDSIDCIIRETATNQDGRSQGLTVPSSTAQAALIRKAYANVGLDVHNPNHQPQFFEAHGTGTKAGDPREAEAIYSSFFGPDFDRSKQETPLYVGGIKTVVGHTEGTAGLAGVLKASLSLQAGMIPPNLLFKNLNPEIAPFYGPLKIPTEAIPWPSLPEGTPRRASVNSFGFGGANAHAILESYTSPETSSRGPIDTPSLAPFVFSASTETALQKSLASFKEYLQNHPDTNLLDLSWTLRARRSALPIKVAVSASSVDGLSKKIDEKLDSIQKSSSKAIGVRSAAGAPKILGVFTGQGAQWAQMGKQLIDTVPYARQVVKDLDATLQSLPETYRPSWSLAEELSRDAQSSRIQEAAFSQPLCTVIQIILVEILRTAGIEFSAVVGHSSGEMGAAYAAGFLSASDAIKIAYLRGFYAPLAKGPSGEKGGMMAIGSSLQDAEELCDRPEFRGRLKVAASNSSSSVTLSGDLDAITQAKNVLDEKKTFARPLKVDTAYHSHHMQPCAVPYVEALDAVGVTVKTPSGACAWYSSVLGGTRVEPNDTLRGTYWRDNMVNTVLFSQAITGAIQDGGPFQMAIEVGPHPALKGPATQTMSELSVDIPYSGTLKRFESDLESVSECLGSVWANFGAASVNLDAVHKLTHDGVIPRLLKNLPSYPWDHDRPYWYESRKSKLFQSRSEPPHELLGKRIDEGNESEYRWRNFLSAQEISWLEGHQIQGQMVFPAAGYVSMALEAAQVIAAEETIQLLEVEDMVIDRAIVFHDEKTGVETIISVSKVVRKPESITADFTISAHLSRDQDILTKVAGGKINITIGEDDSQAPNLPPRTPTPTHLIGVDTDRFYSELKKIGYDYTERFRTFTEMKRRLNFCTGLLERPEPTGIAKPLLVHPGLLDHAFQALFGAYAWPGDGRFWTLFLPTSVRKVTVDPSRCRQLNSDAAVDQLAFDAWLVDSPSREMRGDVVFSAHDEAVIQVEGASMLSFIETAARDDRPMFFETQWGVAAPDGELAVGDERATEEEWVLAEVCERVAHYYWRKLEETLTPSDRENCAEHFKHLLAAISHLFSRPMDGKKSYIKPEWRNDDEKLISELINKYSSTIDIKLAASVGRALPSVIRGETTMLEHMRPDGMLDAFYSDSLGLPATNRYLGRMVKQLSHRFPRMNFIEIGAGTGSSTQAVFDALEGAYSSYTYTDISSGFFENAAARFAKESDKLIFKTMDIEKLPVDQGYTPNSYDVVIASNVLHATTDLHRTLEYTRTLLKPGGYLFLLEITDNTPIRYGFLMGGLSGWWLGVDDGRTYSPCISPSKWNQALRKAGFGGVDAITPPRDVFPNPFSIIAAQSVDDKMDQLRRPLFKISPRGQWNALYVLGGQDFNTSNLIDEVTNTLGHQFDEVITIESLDEVADTEFPPNATVLSLLNLDGPVFQNLTDLHLKALQVLLENTHNLLWITHAQERDDPWSNATVGFFRSASAELPTLRVQILDFDGAEKPTANARAISEALLRLLATDEWERDPAFKEQLLWTTEPELRFRGGKLWVPRVQSHQGYNDRLNVQRRVIKREATGDTIVRLAKEDGSWILRQNYVPKSLPSDTPKNSVAIKVQYSTLWAPQISDEGSLLLVVGQEAGTSQWIAALTTERCSVVHVDRALTCSLPDLTEEPLHFITALLAEVLSERISKFSQGSKGPVLVYEPDSLLASALLEKTDLKVKFLTEDLSKTGAQWIRLHPRQSARTLGQILPQNASVFVHIGSPSSSSPLADVIKANLPTTCRVVQDSFALPPLYPEASDETIGSKLKALVTRTRKSIVAADKEAAQNFAESHLITLAELQQEPKHVGSLTLVDWHVGDSLAVEVSRPQPEALFKKDKTYMLVGMTGEMGLSLCRWMVQSGAGSVVLTSRNPKIDRAWIDELEATGAKIKVGAFDATSREAWIRFAAELKNELPPLAGIINGAVVLQDQMFLDMDINGFNGTLAPKIDSTIHLDEVFRDATLDFFIVFSSLSSIIGNRGQANYNAANAFMTSFVRQRQARGQAASVLHLGSIVGVGYLTRAGDVMETILDRYGYMPVSEVDLHHLVAQAFMAGLPGSGENPDIITGLRYAREDEESGLHWANNPRFAHMVLPPEKEEVETGDKKVVLSARAQLATATTEQEACKALEACFGAKLIAILQMAEDSFRPEAALIELGVDSLVAVEIRSWFLKEVNVDMPVLKILGGTSAIGICQHAIEQMPKELLPAISSAGTDAATATTPSEPGTPEPAKEAKNLGKEKDLPQQPTQLSSTKASSTTSSPAAFTPSPSHNSPPSSIASEEVKPAAPEVLRRVRISSAQSRFWFLNMFLEDRTASNVTLSYNINGRIRVSDLERALKATAQAHESLRTCFIAEDSTDTVWQGVMEKSKLKFEHRSASTDDEVKTAYSQVRHTVYDLEQGDTIQVVLLSRNPNTHTIIFGYHHIVLDGVGFEVFLADVENAYSGKAPVPQGLQYSDFSEKEGQAIEEGSLKKNIAHWQQEFQEIPPLLPLLPVSKLNARRAVSKYGSSYVEHRLDSKLATDLKMLCRKFHVTPSHLYLATFRIMLARLAGVDDLCIGMADANRHHSDVMYTVGLFLNMLPLRFKHSATTPFGDVLKETRTKAYDALGHAGVPFDDLLQALRLPRSASHSPLFQAFFDYHQGAQEKRKFSTTTWENADRNPGERAYDITLDIIEGSAGSLVSLIGQDYIYGIDDMQKILDCYLTLLEQFVKDPSTPAGAANLYAKRQVEAALRLGRGPEMNFQWSPTLGHRVHEMCQQYPDGVALKDDRGIVSLMYKDLEKKARAIRNELVAGGVEPGDRVAVFQEATPDWICSMIAIFWAGAVYVPLVLLNPMPRLAAIVQAAEPTAILAHESTAHLAPDLKAGSTTNIVNVSALSPKDESEPLSIPASGDDPAVILFTSGSTGTPKGIVLRHRNLANHIEGYVTAWKIGREAVLQQSAFSFDLSIGQIFTALSMGGTLVVASTETRGDPVALGSLVRREGITWTLLTPSEYASVLQFGAEELRRATSWKHALSCGEALTRKLVREFAKLGHPSVRLYNCYGPAEAIISATMAEIPFRDDKDDGPVTAGWSNTNYSIYIVDDQRNVLPQGFPGEILIGGCGTAVGYLNDEKQTADKFIADTFESAADRQRGWNVTYRTGDMGRLREDGALMYEGRREGDSQVKIRGFRVDLLDIESTLLNASDGVIADAVVTMRTEAQVLVAHVIFAPDRKPADPATYLRDLLPTLPLPAYMQPTIAVPVDSFPKNLHGKKDRKVIVTLPLPQELTSSASGDVKLSHAERRLAQTWREVLPTEFADLFTLGADTDFFAVGGNSLLLVKLQARIRDTFNVSIPLLQMFDVSSLGKMAARIEASREVQTIDWERETAPDDSLAALAGSAAGARTTGRVVLFTGATGYFGPYLLQELADDSSVATIHCLAVRGDDLAHAQRRVPLSAHPKVVVHTGDLAAPRLGLSADTFAALAASADLVIHSGAKRSFWDSYYELRGPNVLSTREVLRLAAPRRAPVHFLSTSGVLLLSDAIDAAGPASSVAAFPPPVDGSEGYVTSKWASEVLLERAGRAAGLPVLIHRFTPRNEPNSREANDAALRDLLGCTARLGALPERSTWAGRFDVVHSQRLARQICASRFREGEERGEAVFAHHQGEACLSPKELFDFLEEKLGEEVKGRMGLLEWVGAIKKTGYGWLFSTHDLSLTTTEHGVTTTLVNRR